MHHNLHAGQARHPRRRARGGARGPRRGQARPARRRDQRLPRLRLTGAGASATGPVAVAASGAAPSPLRPVARRRAARRVRGYGRRGARAGDGSGAVGGLAVGAWSCSTTAWRRRPSPSGGLRRGPSRCWPLGLSSGSGRLRRLDGRAAVAARSDARRSRPAVADRRVVARSSTRSTRSSTVASSWQPHGRRWSSGRPAWSCVSRSPGGELARTRRARRARSWNGWRASSRPSRSDHAIDVRGLLVAADGTDAVGVRHRDGADGRPGRARRRHRTRHAVPMATVDDAVRPAQRRVRSRPPPPGGLSAGRGGQQAPANGSGLRHVGHQWTATSSGTATVVVRRCSAMTAITSAITAGERAASTARAAGRRGTCRPRRARGPRRRSDHRGQHRRRGPRSPRRHERSATSTSAASATDVQQQGDEAAAAGQRAEATEHQRGRGRAGTEGPQQLGARPFVGAERVASAHVNRNPTSSSAPTVRTTIPRTARTTPSTSVAGRADHR